MERKIFTKDQPFAISAIHAVAQDGFAAGQYLLIINPVTLAYYRKVVRRIVPQNQAACLVELD